MIYSFSLYSSDTPARG